MSVEVLSSVQMKMKIEPRDKKDEENGKKRDESGDEYERKEIPLEIGEHYLVKRGEDSWSEWRHIYYSAYHCVIRFEMLIFSR